MNGDLIKKRLFELGMSREELAVQINCSASTISSAIGGKRLGEKNIFQMAKALGVTPEQLLKDPKQQTA